MSAGISLYHYLTLGGFLFALSVVGIFMNRRNLIVLLMAIELMLFRNRATIAVDELDTLKG
jgi:NADH-quinone oxidoreductase subunit K